MIHICRLRIDPEEVSSPATCAAQSVHYKAVRARLYGLPGDRTGRARPAPSRAVIPPPESISQLGVDHDAHVQAYLSDIERADGVLLSSRPDMHVRAWQFWRRYGFAPAPDEGAPLVTVAEIIAATCRYFNVSRTDLISQRRQAAIVRPRQVAMYLAKTLTTRSLPQIGRQFDGRDHTTVLHAVRKIGALLKADASIAGDVAAISEMIRG